jgi:hypothetical protein
VLMVVAPLPDSPQIRAGVDGGGCAYESVGVVCPTR